MSYTQELLSKADEIIPKVTLVDFQNDLNSKIMIDVRQIEELKASGSIKGSVNIPKGVIEFRLNNDDEVSYETSIYVFCAVGVRSAIAGYNLKKIGYSKCTEKYLVKAFQMRFRPELINGKIDKECLEISKSIVKA